jgi:N-acetylglucosamine-6-phosphate deacetylase
MKALVNGTILMRDRAIEGKALLFDDTITGVIDREDTGGCETIDARGLYITPGLVDVHIHGYLGDDASDGNADGLRRIARALLANGVTSFLPTTMTMPWDVLEKAFAAVRTVMNESAKTGFSGAQILGCHAEGPFINPEKKGCQDSAAILPPDADKALEHQDVIRLMTIAPEMPGGMAFIRRLTSESGITLSMGHTAATYEQALAAFHAGVTHVTHLFNAMTGLHHRNPGTVGAALGHDVTCELIADTFHVHPGLFRVLRDLKGNRLALVTDCTRAGGLKDGAYTLGGQTFHVNGMECRLADGTIAGSVLKLNEAVRNMRIHADIPLYEAVAMASANPAASIGADKTKGALEAGRDADIVLMDGECRVYQVYLKGCNAYIRI